MKLILLSTLILISGMLTSCASKTPDNLNVAVSEVLKTDLVKPQERIVLQWEVDPTNKAYEPWSDHIVKLVEQNLPKFKKGDWKNHCAKWDSLTDRQKTRVIGVDIVATIFKESGYVKTSRMVETTMGIDPVTGAQVASEGLLQLSYQDKQWAVWCDFDWKVDKNYGHKDPRKSIFDPYKNLSCGIPILANEINKRGVVYYDKSYWAVRRPNGKYTQVNFIKSKLAKYAPECK